MVFLPFFVLLFAGWMLWGWTVGESKNIRWLRRTCAPAFVVTMVLIAGGAGAGVSRALTRKQVEADVTKLLETIELRIRTGGSDQVVSEIRSLDHSDDPDGDTFDLLAHLSVMNDNLLPDREQIAEAPSKEWY